MTWNCHSPCLRVTHCLSGEPVWLAPRTCGTAFAKKSLAQATQALHGFPVEEEAVSHLTRMCLILSCPALGMCLADLKLLEGHHLMG